MADDGGAIPDQDLLSISIESRRVPVSYLSSLLRVVQAALREVASTDDRTRPRFSERPQPVLLLSNVTGDGDMTLRFIFVDPVDSRPLLELSSRVFSTLLDRFSGFVRALPQPSLWGGAARRPPARPFESELAKRMDQLYWEFRRSPRVTMSFRTRTIRVEGERMEFE